MLAAEPTNVKFPATVLTHAKINHALSGLAPVVAIADAATRGPSNKTKTKKNTQKSNKQIMFQGELLVSSSLVGRIRKKLVAILKTLEKELGKKSIKSLFGGKNGGKSGLGTRKLN